MNQEIHKQYLMRISAFPSTTKRFISYFMPVPCYSTKLARQNETNTDKIVPKPNKARGFYQNNQQNSPSTEAEKNAIWWINQQNNNILCQNYLRLAWSWTLDIIHSRYYRPHFIPTARTNPSSPPQTTDRSKESPSRRVSLTSTAFILANCVGSLTSHFFVELKLLRTAFLAQSKPSSSVPPYIYATVRAPKRVRCSFPAACTHTCIRLSISLPTEISRGREEISGGALVVYMHSLMRRGCIRALTKRRGRRRGLYRILVI